MKPKVKIYPFTIEQLQYLQKEIDEAGDINEMLVKKEAMIKNEQKTIIGKYHDIEEYKKKHLIGIYQPLRRFYRTKIPFTFWLKMITLLKKI